MELLDVYDINGNKTGRIVERNNCSLTENEKVKVVVVWLKCGNKFLIQKVSKQKGGLFAVTGGAVSSGNTSKIQAQIEVMEELGYNLDLSHLKFLGSFIHNDAIFDVYMFENNNLIKTNFVLQESEVESIYWLSKTEIEEKINMGIFRKSSIKGFEKFIKNNY